MEESVIPYPKRLIEVDLPIKRISAHARREKSIRHGHISTLHIWWARRPLAACRAVLCAALWPDPADPLCPAKFRQDAMRLISEFAAKATSDKELKEHCSKEAWNKWQVLVKKHHELDPGNPGHCNILRFALLDFIADFANWDNSTVPEYLETARALTRSAHESLGGAPGTRPLVVDPFAGGGSIPLEALRIGADAFASDLNPVAVLLNKVVLEYIPKYGKRLADEVRGWGQWVKEQAVKELSEFYPKDPDGSTPIAYLWARTITCEGPGCGSEVPLIRSLWLAKKGRKSVALRIEPNRQAKRVDFEITEGATARDVGEGTVRRGSATCPSCGYTTRVESVRRQLKLRRGGASDARLMAVCRGSDFRTATPADERAIRASKLALDTAAVPSERISSNELRRISVPLYGMTSWGDIFSARQKLALTVFGRHVGRVLSDGSDAEFRAAVIVCLALAVDRCADYWSSLATWMGDFVGHTFTRQAVPFVTDFAEVSSVADGSGSWLGAVNWVARVLEREASSKGPIGIAQLASASDHP